MKRALFITVLLISFGVFADSVEHGKWRLKLGKTKIGTYTTPDLCIASATEQPSGNYKCLNTIKVTVESNPVPPAPSCTHTVRNGTYSNTFDSKTYPVGSTVCAESDGGVTLTGNFNPSGYNMRGFIVSSNKEKSVSNGTFERMSFVGGPACGNTVNTSAGGNTTIRDSAFYGEGGRYLFISWETSNIHLENIIFRVDGGWGESSGCHGWEPNAAAVLYDTGDASCTGCINFDQKITAHSNSENLGGIGINAHTLDMCYDVEIRDSVDRGRGFFAEGYGRCDELIVNSEGNYNRNLAGTGIIEKVTGDNCNAWNGSVNRISSDISSGNCSSIGPGAAVELKTQFLDDPRWRSEMCASRLDGWCASSKTLSGYIN